MPDTSQLLRRLPSFQGTATIIVRNQEVGDIIKEILDAHNEFAKDYDKIFLSFDAPTIEGICRNVFDFCKKNILYKVESEAKQTTKSPSGILSHGYGDCKHYSLFIGGILDAFNRYGKNINWCFRFASYSPFDRSPQHVFIVVNPGGKEIWIDPVLPTFNNRKAYNFKIDKKPMLQRIHGVGKFAPAPGDMGFDYTVATCQRVLPTAAQLNAIQLLYDYGIINSNAQIDTGVLRSLETSISPKIYSLIADAYNLINSAAIGNIFATIFRGVKVVTLAVPRNAYLSLVAINAFGYASKLKKYVWADTGDYNLANKEKLKDLWQNKFGGQWSNLENTIKRGAAKKRIFGPGDSIFPMALDYWYKQKRQQQIGVVPAVPAWVAAASAIIAAITPLLKAILAPNDTPTLDDPSTAIDPTTGLPYGYGSTGIPATTGNNNTLLIAAGGLVAVLLFTQNKKKSQ